MNKTTLENLTGWLNFKHSDIPAHIRKELIATLLDSDKLTSTSEDTRVVIVAILIDFLVDNISEVLQDDLRGIMQSLAIL